jgi:N-methylhydantoinase A/oxoprolinase/acetone carboxylase beta subunit
MSDIDRPEANANPVDFPALLSGLFRVAREMGLNIYNAENIKAGNITCGPCIVEQHSATIVVPPGGVVEINEQGDFMITLDD